MDENIIRNKIILGGGIGKGGYYFNPYVFFPRNEDGYRDYHYYQPSFCYSRSWQGKESKKVDIRKHREGSQSGSLMNRGRSEQVMMMWERLREVSCLRELVILLSDEDLKVYREGLTQEGYGEEKLKEIGLQRHWYLNYMSADFYFPEYKMIFELDSSYHIPEIDKARDRMLFMQYGLKTHRFFRYDLSPYQHEPQILVALGSGKLSIPLYFNQLDLIQERWLTEVGEEKAAEILNSSISENLIRKQNDREYKKFNVQNCRGA